MSDILQEIKMKLCKYAADIQDTFIEVTNAISVYNRLLSFQVLLFNICEIAIVHCVLSTHFTLVIKGLKFDQHSTDILNIQESGPGHLFVIKIQVFK